MLDLVVAACTAGALAGAMSVVPRDGSQASYRARQDRVLMRSLHGRVTSAAKERRATCQNLLVRTSVQCSQQVITKGFCARSHEQVITKGFCTMVGQAMDGCFGWMEDTIPASTQLTN